MSKRNPLMASQNSHHSIKTPLKRMGMLLLYPDLKGIPEHDWAAALNGARRLPLDTVELIGIVAGVVLATWMLRDLMPAADVATATTLNVMRFLLAIPLLALFGGPFLLRRTRRGLESLRQQRETATGAKAYIKEVSHE